MTHYRATYRSLVRAAVTGAPAFADVTVLSAWAHNISDKDLPVFGVATPTERKDRDSLDTSQRDTVLQVALKRLGHDTIDDTLDDDSIALEQIVETALQANSISAVLEETSIQVDGSGEFRVGTLMMTFRISAQLPEPISD